MLSRPEGVPQEVLGVRAVHLRKAAIARNIIMGAAAQNLGEARGVGEWLIRTGR